MMITKKLAGVCILFLAAVGCGEGDVPPEEVGTLSSAVHINSSEIVTWNDRTRQAIVAGATNNLVQSRVYTMVHVAMHDAVNATDREYEGYAYEGHRRRANSQAAAASAAHGVLVHLYPAQVATIDGWLAASLAAISDTEERKERGVEVGQEAADAIITLRLNDGWNGSLPYTPLTGPGFWQPTPPAFGPAAFPHWQFVTPWAMESPDQFRLKPPPKLKSGRYTDDYNEVKAIGQDSSTVRTADEAHRVDFFFEGHQVTLNNIARLIAPQKNLDLWEAARFFALLNIGISDAYIGGFEAKYEYSFWRPVTAIRAGDSDTNDDTVGDPAWTPFKATPSHPDYPSTHSVSGGAGLEVILRFFNFDDDFNLTFTTTSAVPAGSTRTYTSVMQFALDNMNSRVHAGIHFRSACERGLKMGRKIGKHAFKNVLRRVH